MAKENNRFEKTYSQGGVFDEEMQVWVDKKTGVNYLFCKSGYAGGLTPLLGRDGTPVISTVSSVSDKP